MEIKQKKMKKNLDSYGNSVVALGVMRYEIINHSLKKGKNKYE